MVVSPRRGLARVVATEPTPFVVGQDVAVVVAGGVDPDSRHQEEQHPRLGGHMERRIWTGLKHKLENDGDGRTS
jgi:hypothetical protein